MGNSCTCLNLCRTEKEIEHEREVYHMPTGKPYNNLIYLNITFIIINNRSREYWKNNKDSILCKRDGNER